MIHNELEKDCLLGLDKVRVIFSLYLLVRYKLNRKIVYIYKHKVN
jgi:hypothetical protein